MSRNSKWQRGIGRREAIAIVGAAAAGAALGCGDSPTSPTAIDAGTIGAGTGANPTGTTGATFARASKAPSSRSTSGW